MASPKRGVVYIQECGGDLDSGHSHGHLEAVAQGPLCPHSNFLGDAYQLLYFFPFASNLPLDLNLNSPGLSGVRE